MMPAQISLQSVALVAVDEQEAEAAEADERRRR